jgi:hypothetical protein
VTVDEPSLDDVARRYPDWHCWRGVDQLFHAQLRDSYPPILVRGEDPLDLQDMIQAAIYRAAR